MHVVGNVLYVRVCSSRGGAQYFCSVFVLNHRGNLRLASGHTVHNPCPAVQECGIFLAMFSVSFIRTRNTIPKMASFCPRSAPFASSLRSVLVKRQYQPTSASSNQRVVRRLEKCEFHIMELVMVYFRRTDQNLLCRILVSIVATSNTFRFPCIAT